MSHRADQMKLLRQAKKAGCTVERMKNGHWKITTPSGESFHAPFSPRNPGGVRTTIDKLRKAGVEL